MSTSADDAITILKAQAQSEARLNYWIFSPLQDIAFVLLTPLPILLAFAVARYGGWIDGLLTFGLTLAMGHYLPGILRAYGDRALFRRFRFRLTVAPLFLISITTWFAYRNLHIVILLAAVWGLWHWMMQAYGFARIYDAKVTPQARTSARLDQMVWLLWFGMCVFVLNNGMPSYVTSFYESGGPRLPAEAFVWFTRTWFTLTVAVTLLYAVKTLGSIREGRSPNPLKFVFIAVTLVYLSYTVSVIERPKMGLVMFEMWHDVQYLAIVWMFNLNRARKNPEAGSFIQFAFRPRAILVLAYVGLCLAFGSLTHAWSLFQHPAVVRVVVSLVTATGMLHYYLDGFIWKIRETETSQALGVRAGAEPERAAPIWLPPLRHAVLWLFFLIPAVSFFVMESQGNVRPMQIYEDIVQAFPSASTAHYQIARELQEAGRLREAKTHFESALALAPKNLPAHLFLGVLLSDQGDLAGAKTHFEEALRLDPRNAELHNDLGIVFDEQGDLQKAKAELELAVHFDHEYSLAENNLGIVLGKLGDLTQARAHHERAMRIDPNFADAHYQLGATMVKQGDLKSAVDQFEQAIRLDAEHYQAHNSLGEALLTQGKLPEAKTHFEQAVRIRPRDTTARKNLALLADRGTP